MFASKDLFFSRPSGYQISRSVRLRSSASATFTRTVGAAATSNQKITFSAWVKRGILSSASNGAIFDAGADASSDLIRFTSADAIQVWFNAAASVAISTTAVYRDPSACYHIIMAIDTTQATTANRILIYVNGVVQATTGTQPTLSATFAQFNQNTIVNRLGYYNSTYFDGYITEVNVVDGQQLTPSSFGQYNANGVWSPIKYAGTYGTNGFYLNFSDNSASTATTIGKDNSGNGNNWTPNNISVTAGVTYDSMLDVPTPYADGGNGRGNYPVVSVLDIDRANVTTSDGNLKNVKATASDSPRVVTTMGATSGKWYCEVTWSSITDSTPNADYILTGVTTKENWVDTSNGYNGVSYVGANTPGAAIAGYKQIFTNGTAVSTAYGANYFTAGSVIGIALDLTGGTVTFYKNNVSQGAITLPTTSQEWFFFCTSDGTSNGYTNNFNFGQQPFTYTPPTGYVALNTQNLSTPTIANGAAYMAATTYTGTGASLTIANTVNSASFQPDFVWVKARSSATNNRLYDSVRGANLVLSSNTTDAEATPGGTGGVTAFNSNGFSLGNAGADNASAVTFIGWQWKAGTTSASNTNGSITSTVSVGATQGFSVVTYTGVGGLSTVGHGLGVAPRMIIVMPRSFVSDKYVYHASIGAANFVSINLTSASAATALWNSTSPTSTVFTVNGNGANQNTSTFVAYCFSEVAGYSAFGSYTGNGSANGPFVYLGFRPRFIMIKRTDAVSNWTLRDTSRDTSNTSINDLYANSSNAESSAGANIDILSNGFKCRDAGGGATNASGGTYIYAAFAENPFKYSLAR